MLLDLSLIIYSNYHYLLIMILLSSKIIRLYHFTRPILSSFKSLKDLQSILQKRLVANIKEVNASRLKHYSFAKQITQQLKLTTKTAKQIQNRTIQLSLINTKTQQHQTKQVKLNQDIKKIYLNPSDFAFPFPEHNSTMHHFSQFRGVPTFSELNEYPLNNKKLMIFNLPDDITPQDIQVILRAKQVQIRLQYCILGLIAYAEVEFPSSEELDNCLQRFPTKTLQFGDNDRIARIRSFADKQKLQLGNRRLVVNIDQNKKLSEMIIEFSKHGRVLNIEWPIEAWVNPTLDEVKKHYHDTTQLIKINQLLPDGTIQSEYFPALKAWQNWQDERETQNLIDKAERLQASYQNRARFAKNINIYPGKQHELMTNNKGYCVVTYSTYEQCQNYYFSTGSQQKIQLVGDKLEFEYDPTYRRELLRHIDNQFLIGRKKEIQLQKQRNKQYSHMIEMTEREKVGPNTELSYKIADALLKKLSYQESMSKTRNYKIFRKKNRRKSNALYQWKQYLNKMKEQKDKTKRKSFDQLAEIELYGRVLPKDISKERLIVEDTTYTKHPYEELVRQHRLITNIKLLYRRRKFYRRQNERNNRMADQRAGKVHAQRPNDYQSQGKRRYRNSNERSVTKQIAQVQTTETGEIGKQPFSTCKTLPLYRKRTPHEQANYNRRFFQFMRSTIFEYMGIFQDKTIQEVADHKPQLLNPQSLKWPDGTPFLVEQQLTTILQFRRHFEKAQQDFNNYIFGSQYVKSSGENLSQLFSNFKQQQTTALQYMTDVGIVEEVKKITGDNLQQKANILNAQIANFGEEYRVEYDTNTNTNYLIKVRKLEHLLPMDRVAHLQKFITEHGGQISKKEASIFSQHYTSMKQKDIIPDQVSDAFGVQRGKKFSDLLAEIGTVHQISRKDLQMTQRAKTYSSEQLKRDLDNQVKLEKSRKHQRKINSNNLAKDPSQIYVKDREGYYKVSRFRQI